MRVKGLGQKLRDSLVPGFRNPCSRIISCEHDDRDQPIGRRTGAANVIGQFYSIDRGHVPIRYNDIRAMAAKGREGLVSIAGRDYGSYAQLFQNRRDQMQHGLGIFHHESAEFFQFQ